MMHNQLDTIFYPQSVAVVGASRNPRKAAHQILKGMVDNDYKGKVFPVNPKETELLGFKCYSSLLEIPEKLDLVVVGVPAFKAREIMLQAEKRGDVKGVIILSAGFAETGIKERVELEEDIVAVAKRANMRVFGPNCTGVINTDNGIKTSFAPGTEMVNGNIGYFSQSGALGGSLLMLAADQPQPLGFNKWAHVGNMCDVSNIEILAYYEKDPAVQVICGYMEGVKDGRLFMDYASRVSTQKPILLLKVGRTEVGSRATLSHTGTLAGSDRIYDAAFTQSGVVRVDTMDELVTSAKALSMSPLPKGNRICILTEAGGPGIIAMDEIGSDSSVTLAPITSETEEKLNQVLPPMAMICKPNGYIDMSAAAMENEHVEALKLVLEDPAVDSVILISLPPTFLPANELARQIAAIINQYNKPVMICFMKGKPMQSAREYFEQEGIPTFDNPNQAARALINMTKAAKRLGNPVSQPRWSAVKEDDSHPLVNQAVTEKRNLLEFEATTLLTDYGIEMLPQYLAQSPSEAVQMADKIGYPVVLKIVSPQIIHKSEFGGVKLNLQNAKEVIRAHDDLVKHINQAVPEAEIKGVLVTPFIKEGIEVITGLVKDPQFGPVVMFGAGGILVEVFKDVSFRVAPFDEEEALSMIKETKAYHILRGLRGNQQGDIASLAKLLVKLGDIAINNPSINEIDLNPVRVLEQGLAVLDARIIL